MCTYQWIDLSMSLHVFYLSIHPSINQFIIYILYLFIRNPSIHHSSTYIKKLDSDEERESRLAEVNLSFVNFFIFEVTDCFLERDWFPYIYLSIYLSIHISIDPYIYLLNHGFIYPTVFLRIYVFFYDVGINASMCLCVYRYALSSSCRVSEISFI